jgi:hypothetical protein
MPLARVPGQLCTPSLTNSDGRRGRLYFGGTEESGVEPTISTESE